MKAQQSPIYSPTLRRLPPDVPLPLSSLLDNGRTRPITAHAESLEIVPRDARPFRIFDGALVRRFKDQTGDDALAQGVRSGGDDGLSPAVWAECRCKNAEGSG